MSQRIAILVFGDEELFIELMGLFPAKQYELVFVEDPSEGHRWLSEPRTLILVTALDKPGDPLETLLRDARSRGHRVLGLSTETLPPPHAEQCDRIAEKGDIEAIRGAITELCADRRRLPRVASALLLFLEGLGEIQACAVSAETLFIPTETPLEQGAMVQVILTLDGQQQSCPAVVKRVGPGEAGLMGMTLEISEHAVEVREGLKRLVQQVLIQEHQQPPPQAAEDGGSLEDDVMSRCSEGKAWVLAERQKTGETPRPQLQEEEPPAPCADPASDDLAALSHQVSEYGVLISTLQERMDEIARGSTHALVEIFESSDGLQQQLKLHAKQLSLLQKKVSTPPPIPPSGESGKKPAADDHRDHEAENQHRQQLIQQGEELATLRQQIDELSASIPQTAGPADLAAENQRLGQQLAQQGQELAILRQQLNDLNARVRQSPNPADLAAEDQRLRRQLAQQGEELALQGQELAQQGQELALLRQEIDGVVNGATEALIQVLEEIDTIQQHLISRNQLLTTFRRKLTQAAAATTQPPPEPQVAQTQASGEGEQAEP